MTIWQKFALGLSNTLGGVLGGLFDAFMRLCGVDMAQLRADAAEQQAAREAQAVADAKAAREREEDLALREATLAALLDLAPVAAPVTAPTAWEPPERGQVDPAVAAERRARHQAIKAASAVEVRACDYSDPEVDEELRWRVA